RESLAGDERRELRQPGEAGNAALEVPAGGVDRALRHGAAKERLRVDTTGDQFDVDLDERGQLANLGALERLLRQQRHLRVRILEILEDHLRLAQRALRRSQEGHLAERAGLQG